MPGMTCVFSDRTMLVHLKAGRVFAGAQANCKHIARQLFSATAACALTLDMNVRGQAAHILDRLPLQLQIVACFPLLRYISCQDVLHLVSHEKLEST